MTHSAVSRRYAKGLLAAVLEANEPGQTPEIVAGELEALAEAVRQHSSLALVVMNPAIDSGKKGAVLEQVAGKLGLGLFTRRLVALLAEKERLAELQSIARSMRALVDDHLQIVNAEVTTPAPLDEAAVQDLRKKLETAHGKTVRLKTRVDPELLGGLVTRIGDVLYDGSLRHQLARMRGQMTHS